MNAPSVYLLSTERLSVNPEKPEFLEIMATPARPVAENKDELVAAFEVFDKDGSGSVSPSELRSVLISLGQRHSDEEIDEMVRQADLDNNGSIDCKWFPVPCVKGHSSRAESRH